MRLPKQLESYIEKNITERKKQTIIFIIDNTE